MFHFFFILSDTGFGATATIISISMQILHFTLIRMRFLSRNDYTRIILYTIKMIDAKFHGWEAEKPVYFFRNSDVKWSNFLDLIKKIRFFLRIIYIFFLIFTFLVLEIFGFLIIFTFSFWFYNKLSKFFQNAPQT